MVEKRVAKRNPSSETEASCFLVGFSRRDCLVCCRGVLALLEHRTQAADGVRVLPNDLLADTFLSLTHAQRAIIAVLESFASEHIAARTLDGPVVIVVQDVWIDKL